MRAVRLCKEGKSLWSRWVTTLQVDMTTSIMWRTSKRLCQLECKNFKDWPGEGAEEVLQPNRYQWQNNGGRQQRRTSGHHGSYNCHELGYFLENALSGIQSMVRLPIETSVIWSQHTYEITAIKLEWTNPTGRKLFPVCHQTSSRYDYQSKMPWSPCGTCPVLDPPGVGSVEHRTK